MGKIQWFKEYLLEIQTAVNDINSNRLVIDDSQLTQYLSEHPTTKNYLIVGVLPDFGSNAATADSYMLRASTQLMVLKKASVSEQNYDAYYKMFDDAYVLTELVLKKLIKDSLSGCNNLRFLNASSVQIVPVWNKNECFGWNILFNFDLNV